MVDIPDLPPQNAQVIIAQAGVAKQGATKTNRTLGVCQVIENQRLPSGEPDISAINSISPIGWVQNYFRSNERRQIEGPSTVTVLEDPKHGKLRDEGTVISSGGTLVDTGKREYSYIPAPGYLGKDGAVVLVEMGGMKIRIAYTLHVVDMVNQDTEGLCPPGNVRKISLNPDNSNGGLISFQHLNSPQAIK